MLPYTGLALRHHIGGEVTCQSKTLFHLHLRHRQRTELLKGLLNLQEINGSWAKTENHTPLLHYQKPSQTKIDPTCGSAMETISLASWESWVSPIAPTMQHQYKRLWGHRHLRGPAHPFHLESSNLRQTNRKFDVWSGRNKPNMSKTQKCPSKIVRRVILGGFRAYGV